MDYFNPQPKPEKTPKKAYSGLKRTSIKRKAGEPKNKPAFFLEIFQSCQGLCMVTGEPFPLDNSFSFMHILGHGAFPNFEFYKKNVWFVNPRIHTLYDNVGAQKLLEEFPQAIMIYDLAELLKIEYYKPKPIV